MTKQQRYKQRKLQYVWDYLSEHPCKCGEDNPIVLEFAHKSSYKKVDSVSELICNKGWEVLKKEIEKTEVKCVKCHRLETAEEQNWYKDIKNGKHKYRGMHDK